ncbi:MAG TPA: condensation domain-containing protein, partial [Thermoanaerobaculia bacterium]|nr:condensation domain-containing protein [Thermoanaerobaculia bacterium]
MSTTAPATTGFALSPQQARWWALGGTDHPAFLARAVIEITGPLDVGRLEGALADLSARFEVLRTRFQALPGVSVPLQVIEEPSPLPLDKKTLGPGALPDALAAELEQLASQAIQGERKPLALRLLELGPERHALLLVQPSGLADRRGLENLCRELARSYQARLEGRQLEAEEVQYADLAQWQNEVLADPEHRLGGDYFADVAARGALALALPGRR